jgi:GNAT superfamily N-acetyltransferase
MDSPYRHVTARERPEIRALSTEVASAVWPRFMLHDPIADRLWHHLYEAWPDYQFAVLDEDRVVALGNSVPLRWDQAWAELPEEGWDWVFTKAVDDLRAGCAPDLVSALQIMVLPEHQGGGLSEKAVRAMKRIAAQHGCADLIVPLRPTRKCEFPLEEMEQYVARRDDKGLPFDPWLRVHVRLGAEIVKICHRSMEIRGTIEEWTNWTGRTFLESGRHVVPGALAPVDVNVEANLAVYVEPNVWLRHSTDTPRDGENPS